MKCMFQTWNFLQHWYLRIHISGCIRNQVFPEWIFSVPDYKGVRHILHSLSLEFLFGERVAVEVWHPLTRCLEAKLLIASEMAVSLKMPDCFIPSVSMNQHILPTHPAVKLAQIICSISGPGNEELSPLANSVPFFHLEGTSGAHPSPRLLDISVRSTCVGCVRHTLLLIRHGCPLCYFLRHLIKLRQQKTHGDTKELRSQTQQFWSTNWSLTDPGADFSPPPPQSDKRTPADVLWLNEGRRGISGKPI